MISANAAMTGFYDYGEVARSVLIAIAASYAALDRNHTRRVQEAEVSKLRDRYELLTAREREVLPLVVSGLPSKQIADAIAATEATVKVHRSQLMRKMGAKSVADLVRMAEKMAIPILKQA